MDHEVNQEAPILLLNHFPIDPREVRTSSSPKEKGGASGVCRGRSANNQKQVHGLLGGLEVAEYQINMCADFTGEDPARSMS